MSDPKGTNWYVAENKRLRTEVERLRQRLEQVKALSAETVRAAEAEIERLREENEKLRNSLAVALDAVLSVSETEAE